MKPLSNKTDSRPGYKADASGRYVLFARAAILWERVWRATWPASGIVGLFAAAALFGLFENVPQALHLALLFLVVLAAGSFLHRNLKGFAVPRWEDGARRVEQDSQLAHRPIVDALRDCSGDRSTRKRARHARLDRSGKDKWSTVRSHR